MDETLNPILKALCRSAGVAKERILRMCVASNTTMNHLLLGVEADLGPHGAVYSQLLPLARPQGRRSAAPCPRRCRRGFGPPTSAPMWAAISPPVRWPACCGDKDEFTLFIDLGTNGELVFGNRDFMMSCACSAGPAFEGGDISCGMRATDGAIEAITIDKDTMEPTLSIVGEPGQKVVGLCGSGIIDLISELYRCGIISAKGQFVREGKRVRRDEHGTGRYVLAFEGESATGREVSLNEVDIDSFIRAKGAIFSAIDTMLSSLDMDVSVLEHVLVAGGIGSGINMKNAVNIGMLPDIPLEKFSYIGNSSLAGAYAMALSTHAEEKTYELAANMTYLELSTNPGYMDNFVAACFIPHTNGSLFPSSRQEV